MPQINIEYDNEVLDDEKAAILSLSIQEIVSKATEIKDVFVYTNSAQIKVQVAPIEIFIRLSANILEKKPELMKSIKSEISKWKEETNFETPINLTLIPMNWQIEIGI